MRAGTKNLAANLAVLPNRMSIACPYFSSQAAGAVGGSRNPRTRSRVQPR